ncbi:hypothetical protein F4678DRAFT_471294 [Xylaria arbuscula]|nr:hypothetical protein F4678DRAFT_471294 [Xylaria arbuscula]
MAQMFQLVAPRAKLTVPESGDLDDMLFEYAGRELIRRLVIPIRPQYNREPLAQYQSGDDEVQADSSLRQKQIKTQATEQKRLDAAVTFYNLPTELHHLVFSSCEDIADVVSLGLTNQYFLSLVRSYVDDYLLLYYGTWAGTNVVCVGSDVDPNDYPPGLFSARELEGFRHQKTNLTFGWDKPKYSEKPSEFTLGHFTSSVISTVEPEKWPCLDLDYREHLLRRACKRRGLYKDPAWKYIKAQTRYRDKVYFPKDQKWILRNWTTKQIVRLEPIGIRKRNAHDLALPVGLGDVVMSRIFWSTHKPINIKNLTYIPRGVWAGHCFDITTLSRHEAETGASEWSDVSDEVARELASIWEGGYGPKWRSSVLQFDSHRRWREIKAYNNP